MSTYKPTKRSTTLSSAIADAFSTLEELGSECREVCDNMPESLQNTERYSTMDNTASKLEGISEPDVPEAHSDLQVTYVEQVQGRRGRGTARHVHCTNAVNMLQGATETIDKYMEDHQDDAELDTSELEQLKFDIEEIISTAEGCEFPGMRG